MDCRTARLLLDFAQAKPPELDSPDAAALDGHLADCPECCVLFRSDAEADERLGAAMRQVAIPEGLRSRVLARLTTERRGQTWSWRRRMTVAVAAAALLLTTAGAYYWMHSHRPEVAIEEFLANMEDVPDSSERAEAWFAERYGIRTVAPTEFNYGLLAYCSLGDVQGRRVPELRFSRGDAEVRVYILSSSQFNLRASLGQGAVGSGGYTVMLRPHPTNPQIAYLVVYRGGPLEQFLVEAGRQTA